MKLKELREERNLYQKDIGRVVNKVANCISNWEKGLTEPGITDIIKLADYFGVSTDELLGRANIVGVVEVKNELTTNENELLKIFRTLNEKMQQRAIGIVFAVAKGY